MSSRIPALDGLRGLAILLVLAGHIHIQSIEVSAAVGVTLFFVLSGFLITGILVRQADEGGILYVEFYKRRARRLFPALLLMLVVAALLSPEGWWNRIWPAMMYVGNWPLMHGVGMGNVAHVWSLAVEEHFYLVWPLVIGAVTSRWRVRTIGLLAVGFGLWRLGLVAAGTDWARVYYGTDTNAYAVLTGSFIAVARLPKLHPMAGLVAIAGLVWIGLRPWSPGAVGLLFVAVVLAAVAVHVAAISLPAVEARWLRWFGTVSYGLYLWHAPILDTVAPTDRWLVVPLAVLVAWASWVCVERPILNARKRNLSEVSGLHRAGTAEVLRNAITFQPVERMTPATVTSNRPAKDPKSRSEALALTENLGGPAI